MNTAFYGTCLRKQSLERSGRRWADKSKIERRKAGYKNGVFVSERKSPGISES